MYTKTVMRPINGFQVVDETFSLVGSMVLSAISDPVRLVKIITALLGIAFLSLLAGNFVSLAGKPNPSPHQFFVLVFHRPMRGGFCNA